jgi:hypothetical protein
MNRLQTISRASRREQLTSPRGFGTSQPHDTPDVAPSHLSTLSRRGEGGSRIPQEVVVLIHRMRGALVIMAILSLQGPATAQGRAVFAARLSPVPVDTVTVRTTTGSGTLTAVLDGSTLKLTGKFDDLNSPATVARVHRAPKGMRGPNVFDLTVTRGTSGTIEGTLKLSPVQIEELGKGWYYVQLHTELNTAGQLRGWLLK